MGVGNGRLSRLMVAAACAALALAAAACGNRDDPGGVSSADVPRPTHADTTEAPGPDGARDLTAAVVPRPDEEEDGASNQTPLAAAEYHTGECVTWDAVGGTTVQTEVVDCGQPHLVQVTGNARKTDPPGAEYPSAAEWDGFIALECGPLAEAFLGRPLDPYGRYGLYMIRPLPDGWGYGDRGTTCGIAARPPGGGRAEGDGVFFSGDMLGVIDQGWDHPVGTCLDADYWPIGCERPHQAEVVARFVYTDAPTPPDDTARQVLEGECGRAVDGYMGGAFAPPWAYSLEVVRPESWAAGSRHVHCYVGQATADLADWVEVVGPAPRG